MVPLAISVVLIGMLLASLSLPVRKLGLWLVVPLFLLLPLVVGCLIVLLPCAFGIWDVFAELGTFEQIAWDCPRRLRNVPKPAEILSSRYGWVVVTNQTCDIDAVQAWVHAQEICWSLVIVHP